MEDKHKKAVFAVEQRRILIFLWRYRMWLLLANYSYRYCCPLYIIPPLFCAIIMTQTTTWTVIIIETIVDNMMIGV